MEKKKRRLNIVDIVVIVVILAAAAFFGWKLTHRGGDTGAQARPGTIRFVIRWKRSVPRPAQSKVALGERPVRIGTRIVAPSIANMCWTPSTPIFGRPSVRAS